MSAKEKSSISVDKQVILKELLDKQLKNVNYNKKLQYSDIKRVCKYINSSIFHENECSVWTGYVTNEKNTHKATYINFFFNKRKVALHRLIYANFIGPLSDHDYLKFTCDNKGKCCNIHHMIKYTYNKADKYQPKKQKKKDNGLTLYLEFD